MTTTTPPGPPPYDPRFAVTFWTVEASSVEQHTLCAEHRDRHAWTRDDPGKIITIDTPARATVVCTWAVIDGAYVLFYEPIALSDRATVEAWLGRYCAPRWDGQRAHCGAGDFGRCLAAVAERNRRARGVGRG